MTEHSTTHDARTLATLEVEGGAAAVTLRRPDKRNALSPGLLDALRARFEELRVQHPGVLAVVMRGEGASFCAGMDLKAVLNEPDAPRCMLESIAELTLAIRELPAVVIAEVTGAAIGGGCGLACACDLALTHPDSRLGFPEVDLGVCPAVVTPWVVRRLGASMARKVLLTGGTMSGLEGHAIGLVHECLPKEDLRERVESVANHIAKAGPEALRETKRLLGQMDGEGFTELVRSGAALSAEVIEHPETRGRLEAMFR